MPIFVLLICTFLISISVGFLGALLGLGGGVFLVPALIFLLGMPTHTAISTSIVAVIATSASATATYVEKSFTNVKLALLLVVATTIGAVVGALLASALMPEVLEVLFGLLLIYVSYIMFTKPRNSYIKSGEESKKLKLSGSYYDSIEGRRIDYMVQRLYHIFGASWLAGVLSGLLGVGGGFIYVPAMNILSRIPIKAAVATSNLMVGITAAAASLVYLKKGLVDPMVVAPAVLGLLIGAQLGARTSVHVKAEVIRRTFAVALVLISLRLLLRGLGLI